LSGAEATALAVKKMRGAAFISESVGDFKGKTGERDPTSQNVILLFRQVKKSSFQ